MTYCQAHRSEMDPCNQRGGKQAWLTGLNDKNQIWLEIMAEDN